VERLRPAGENGEREIRERKDTGWKVSRSSALRGEERREADSNQQEKMTTGKRGANFKEKPPKLQKNELRWKEEKKNRLGNEKGGFSSTAGKAEAPAQSKRHFVPEQEFRRPID